MKRPAAPDPVPHIGPVLDDGTKRQRFEPGELAVVLSHYELGIIDRIKAYPRGSPRAPKVRIRARSGDYLLKRRAPGRDDPYRVAFAQSLQVYLAERGYPVPRLIGTTDENNSMLQLKGRIYELFEFCAGTRYDGSAAETEQAGRALGDLHTLLSDFESSFEPPLSSYHAAKGIDARLARIPDAVAAREPDVDRRALDRMCAYLREAYHEAAGHVEATGFAAWRPGIIHGDWHPGNLLYDRQGAVNAVLDFDSARLEPRMADVANAALQFSMTMPEAGDSGASDHDLDLERLRRLVRGYGRATGYTIETEELAALPWLMTEALVLESVIPIAATGSFGGLSGSRFLRMIEGKVHWIAPRAESISRYAEG